MTTKYVQAPEMTLQSSISDVATEAVLTGFVDLSGVPLVQTDFGTLGYGTFEPNTDREEAVAFVVTSNPSGTATLTLTRGLRGKAPYGAGGTAFPHNASTKFVISNNPDLLNKLTAKDNDEVVTGSWSFPETPTVDTNPVTKGHYDDTAVKLTGAQNVAGVKTFTDSPIVPVADAAGEAINKGQFDAEAVKLTGNQTIAGIKTFSSSPVVPTAVNPTDAINKSQVEAFVATNSGDILASNTAFGTVKLSVPAEDPVNPVVIGINDPINEAEADPLASNNENKIPKLEADGRISEQFLRNAVRLESDEDLTVNMPVGIGMDGKIARAARAWASTTNYTIDQIFEVDTNKYVAVYGVSNITNVVVITANPATKTISFGTPQAVPGSGVSYEGNGACKIGTNKVAVSYRVTTDRIDVRAATISGTVFTFGTGVSISTTANLMYSQMCSVGTDKFAFYCWRPGFGTVVRGFCTVSGTTVAVAATTSSALTNITFSSSDNDPLRYKMVFVENDKFAIFNALTGYVAICTTSGSLVDGTAVLVLNGTLAQPQRRDIVAPTAGTLFVRESGAIRYCTVSGTIITVGSAALTISGDTGGQLVVAGGSVYEVHTNSTLLLSGIYLVTQTSGTVVRTQVISLPTTVASYFAASGSEFLAYSGTVFHMRGMAHSFVGYLDAAVNRLASTRVNLSGIKAGLTGIVVGAGYSADNGAFAVDMAGRGIGLTTTSILIR